MNGVQELPTRVLIVDDKRRVREGLRARIETSTLRCSVSTAESGQEALDQLDGSSFDVILCDLRLSGGIDGIEVTRQVRERKPRVRVVVFTGYDEGQRKEDALKAGAFAFLTKPVDYNELVHTIRNVNSIRRTERLEQWFRRLAKISTDLQASFEFDRLASRIVEGVLELGYTCGRLYLFDEDQETLIGKVERGHHSHERFDEYRIPFTAAPVIQEIFKRQEPTIWNRERLLEVAQTDFRENWLTELELEEVTWVDCPLLVKNRRVGTLAVDNCESKTHPCEYTQDDLEILDVFANLAAQALNNSLLYEKEALAHASLEAILRDAPEAMVTADLHGKINFVSASSERVLGYEPREMEGHAAHSFYTDAEGAGEAGADIAHEIMKELERRDPVSKALFLKGKKGSVIPVSSLIRLLHDENGREIGTLAFLKSRNPLEIQSERYRTVLEGFGHGSVLLSPKGKIDFVNLKGERLLGRSREALIGQKFSGLLRPGQEETFARVLTEVLEAGEERSLDLHPLLPNERVAAIEARLTPVKEGRKVSGISLALSDRSELSALIQSGRLMALGQLVAGVAHEINNPLNNLLLASRGLRDHLRKEKLTSERVERDLGNLESEATRISNLIRNMRELAKPGDLRLDLVSLNEVVADSMGFFAARLRNQDVEVVLELASDEPRVQADRGRLQQVLVNLIINAEEAMGDQESPRRLCITTQLLKESTARVTIRDSGPGIPEEVVEAIFDPFFTTKRTGTGLGLSMCKSILDFHNGTIEANNLPGRGAEFIITLPRA